jgi:anti-sigma-K factor RskA
MLSDTYEYDLLPAYAIGCLEKAEADRVAEHLAGCPTCRAELRSYEEVAAQLALGAPEAAPPPRLKQQIVGRIQVPRREPVALPGEAWWERLVALFQKKAPAWGLASLVLMAFLVASNLWWWQRTERHGSMTTAGGMRIIALVGTDAAPDAAGTLVISDDGEHGTLVVDGLPVLGPDQQYQLWLIRDGQRTSGGVYSVGTEGYGALWIHSPEPLASYPSFGVTIEPAGGSPGPTGKKVLGGSL